MISTDAVLIAAEGPKPFDWDRLGAHLPYEWVESALAEHGKASIRTRRLPAQQVVWLVIALALYRHHSVAEIVAELDLAFPDKAKDRGVNGAAVTRARHRLGAEPLEWLCRTSGSSWMAQHDKAHLFNGMTLLSIDGTTLRTPDSPANRAHFGAQAYAKGTVSSYPQVRGATLTHLATHLIIDGQFGPYSTSEKAYAMALLPSVPDQSLTVVDKGFFSAEILCTLTSNGSNRHFLIPAKKNTKWKIVKGDARDGIVEMKVSPQARKNMPTLPAVWQARAIAMQDVNGETCYLLTSLMDCKAFTAADLIACYVKRWQIESSYRELKQTMMGMALTLRSQTVAGIMQEIWGACIAYNLIRMEMASAAMEAECAPTDISFILALHTFQHELMWAAVTLALGKLPALLKRLRQRLVTEVIVKRPGRKAPRVVKSTSQRYPQTKTKA